MHTIDLLHIQFNFELAPDKVKWLKKPISSAISDLRIAGEKREKDELAGIDTELFYNRDEETGKSENRYPLIQYKSVNGMAAITGINEGAEALRKLLAVLSKKENQKVNEKHLLSESNKISLLDYKRPKHYSHTIKLLKYPKSYVIRHWLPLDSVRYKNWMTDISLQMLAELLDECLPRQISQMLGGVGLHHRFPFMAKTSLILAFYPPEQVYKEKKIGFDCVFQSNLDLPLDTGIGQTPGIGYGRVFPYFFNT
jgi:hypothetical protein